MNIFDSVFLANALCDEAVYLGICGVALENAGGDRLDLGARRRSLDDSLLEDEATEPGPAVALPARICPEPVGKEAEDKNSHKDQCRPGAHVPPEE